ncbi:MULTISPECIES: nitroreductase family protein [unclassified Fusibacter]|uniref:nitroreductase family protein n=1 Tax=unclassified Fusibacter TaxID=2624464 RepID=UPI00101072AC|nr:MULTISPECIES: nitroreductase family protein [unclassified Fusibacter]MCK8058608.1 nitroreductase family protein [Fusibacter sp. A2]NPE22622.1 nitroreductase [Fusibacter sp. A1]RXV60186.1 nitroreductase [Fusibacter sp. A1]
MNEVLRGLAARKSVRVFEDRAIGEREKKAILNAAFQAPTAGNQMLYTILDITDQELKDRLAVTCDDQPFIAKAPLVLIFLADCRRWLDAYRHAGLEARDPGAGDLLLACQDAVIAAQNAVVAAESLGIGSCYIGDILENAEEHMAMLHLDEFVLPITMLVFGYPTEQQKEREKPPRFEERFIVQENTYKRLSEEDHRTMMTNRANKASFDYDEFITRFCTRKYMSDFSKEMSRSAAIYLNKFKGE